VELGAEALAAWEPLRSAVVVAVEQWSAELSKFGFGVTALYPTSMRHGVMVFEGP
jgi:hypothetical protein